MECAHVETNAIVMQAGPFLRKSLNYCGYESTTEHVVWDTNKEVVPHTNILRNHDLHEPTMAVLSITKNLVCRAFLYKVFKFRIVPLNFFRISFHI